MYCLELKEERSLFFISCDPSGCGLVGVTFVVIAALKAYKIAETLVFIGALQENYSHNYICAPQLLQYKKQDRQFQIPP